ncbi:uncharacterized protein [Palaemon carinicauda]|uniref:uncharacterized protein n=1 Tax=Palaemon carinicauda TaxID=392227 RepID=UPI0035B5FA38
MSQDESGPYIFITPVWRAGKQLCIPDALSHSTTSRPMPEDEVDCTTSIAYFRRIIASTATSSDDQATGAIIEEDKSLQEIRMAASQDQDDCRLVHYVSNCFPTNHYDLHASALPYWKLWDNLYADGELVLYGPRIVIPAALHRRTLDRLHNSHRETEATRRRAMQTVFWPDFNADIKRKVESYEACQQLLPSQQQKLYMCDDHPSRTFESVSADFFHVAGKPFLIIADRLSGWPVEFPVDMTQLQPELQEYSVFSSPRLVFHSAYELMEDPHFPATTSSNLLTAGEFITSSHLHITLSLMDTQKLP